MMKLDHKKNYVLNVLYNLHNKEEKLKILKMVQSLNRVDNVKKK